MTLRTVGSLIGAANGAKDLQAMAVNFFQNYRRHANGVASITITDQPFVAVAVAVAGTADLPKLTFALVWSERHSWQVTDYLSPDDDDFDESWGADNSCGYHIESEERQHELRLTIVAEHLLMPNDKQIEMLQRWKVADDADKKERARLSKIGELQSQIAKLQKDHP